jgi:O-succinylbenzoate synthase
VTEPVVALELAPVDTVAAVELRRVRLPLLEPFVAAHGTEHEREVVLVHVAGRDGEHGWGECVALSEPTYTAETTASAWVALRDQLVPALLADEPVPTTGHPMAWTAVEVALVDLRLRRQRRALVDALGAARRPIDACAVVGLQPTIDATIAAVGRRVDEGYRAVKLKIAPGHDLEPLAAVRAAFADLALAADANGSFTLDDRSRLEGFGELGLDYLEQPLAADDLAGLARLRPALPYALALDESVASPDDLDRAVAAGAGSIVNVKPGRVGGIAACQAILARAAEAGWGAFVGGMLETGIGRATALAVASHPACTLPTDLGPSDRYFDADLTEPIPLEAGGCLQVPAGSGIGVVPRSGRLDAATVERAELAP